MIEDWLFEKLTLFKKIAFKNKKRKNRYRKEGLIKKKRKNKRDPKTLHYTGGVSAPGRHRQEM